jgi:hypothetical protein
MNGHAAWWLSCTYETNDHVHTRLTKETFTWIKNDINAIDTYLAARGWTWWMLSLVPGCTLDMSTRAIHKQTVEWWIPVLKWAKPFVLRKKRENSRGESPQPFKHQACSKKQEMRFHIHRQEPEHQKTGSRTWATNDRVENTPKLRIPSWKPQRTQLTRVLV